MAGIAKRNQTSVCIQSDKYLLELAEDERANFLSLTICFHWNRIMLLECQKLGTQLQYTCEIYDSGDSKSQKEDRPNADADCQNWFSSVWATSGEGDGGFMFGFAGMAALYALHGILTPIWHGRCRIGRANRAITNTRQPWVHVQMAGSSFVDGT